MIHGAVVQKKCGMQVWFAMCAEHGALGPDVLSWRDADRTALQHNYQHHLPRKEGAPVRTKEQIATEIELAQARLERLIEEKRQVDSLPDEPEANTVIRFDVRFDMCGPTYSYAAIRVGAWWYTTGTLQSQKKLSWWGLLDLMSQDVYVSTGERRLQFAIQGTTEVRKAAKR